MIIAAKSGFKDKKKYLSFGNSAIMFYIDPVDGLNAIVPVDNVARFCVLTIADLADLAEDSFEV